MAVSWCFPCGPAAGVVSWCVRAGRPHLRAPGARTQTAKIGPLQRVQQNRKMGPKAKTWPTCGTPNSNSQKTLLLQFWWCLGGSQVIQTVRVVQVASGASGTSGANGTSGASGASDASGASNQDVTKATPQTKISRPG